MNDDSKDQGRAPAAVYELLERHLPQLARVESVMLGAKPDSERHTELWLRTVLDDHDASAFIAHGSAQLFSSLIIFLAAQSHEVGIRIPDDQLDQTIDAAAAFAGVLPADVRKLLLPARLSFKNR